MTPNFPARPVMRLALALLVASLAACNSNPPRPEHDPAMAKIAAVGEQVAGELKRLRQQDYARNPVAVMGDSKGPSSGPFTRNIAIDWEGPAEPLIKHIANTLGVGFKVIGDPPAHPPIVDIRYAGDQHPNGAPAYDVLRDIGAQVGRSTGIQLIENGTERRIEVLYVKE